MSTPEKTVSEAAITVLLVGALSSVFLAPFNNPYQDIDLQVSMVLVCGVGAALYLLVTRYRLLSHRPNLNQLLVLAFCVCCIMTLLHKRTSLDLLGFEGVRLGFLELMSCITVGWVLSFMPAKQYLRAFYYSTVLLSIFSIGYDTVTNHSVWRLGGPIYQADILAVYLGAGFLIGLYFLHRKRNSLILAAETLLGCTILLTETRIVIYTLVVLGTYLLVIRNKRRWKMAAGCALALLLIAMLLVGSRVTNVGYADASVVYRGDLVVTAFHDIRHEPLFGYGQGSLYTVLACHSMFEPKLLATCRQGYGFTSSHNIFLDKTLELGLLGGVLYFVIYVRALLTSRPDWLWRYLLLLIGVYYLTNVSDVALELLYWCVVIRVMRTDSFCTHSSKTTSIVSEKPTRREPSTL